MPPPVIGTLHAVVHPFAIPSSAHDAGASQISQMSRYFRLALLKDLDEITDAYFPPPHEIEQAKTGGIRKSGKQANQIERLGATHGDIIYGLTDIS